MRVLTSAASLACAIAAAAIVACGGQGDVPAATPLRSAVPPAPERVDEGPVMVGELPFRYPAPLYAQRVQGNVTLRLFIDHDGKVLPESTRVETTSGFAPIDSAAVKGSQALHFVPAKLRGEPVGVTVLFPVYFRHPEAAPLPGDTILGRRDTVSAKRPTTP